MKGWIRRTWLVCVVAMALGAPAAYASGGTITFVGAILAPTCLADAGDVSSMAPGGSGRRSCDGSGSGTSDSASYVVKVSTVAASGIADDRVLRYFSSYARAAGEDDAAVKLVTQTFE
ncbi:hypothetical protein [Dyella humicola]|uniref:hypothetical protein n=1 Tax=Dyella humicola TaxID=2992126 RepID=UPI002253713D|nr:hypothetical protein [Dyella humicola]